MESESIAFVVIMGLILVFLRGFTAKPKAEIARNWWANRDTMFVVAYEDRKKGPQSFVAKSVEELDSAISGMDFAGDRLLFVTDMEGNKLSAADVPGCRQVESF